MPLCDIKKNNKEIYTEEDTKEESSLPHCNKTIEAANNLGSLNYEYLNVSGILHHTAHTTHARSTHRHFGFILLLLYNHTLCSKEHTSN